MTQVSRSCVTGYPFQCSFLGGIRCINEMDCRVRFFVPQIAEEKDLRFVCPLYYLAPLTLLACMLHRLSMSWILLWPSMSRGLVKTQGEWPRMGAI